MKAKVTHVLKTYGRTALLFHTAVFASTFSGAYAAIRNGVDLRETLNKVPFVDLSKMDPGAGTLALAYVSTLATGKHLVVWADVLLLVKTLVLICVRIQWCVFRSCARRVDDHRRALPRAPLCSSRATSVQVSRTQLIMKDNTPYLNETRSHGFLFCSNVFITSP